jgi:hypothetical protein
MMSFRRPAPMACTSGLPAATRRAKKPARSGLNRAAVWVGRNSALRSRGLPAVHRQVHRLPARHLLAAVCARMAASCCSGSWARPYDGVCGTM